MCLNFSLKFQEANLGLCFFCGENIEISLQMINLEVANINKQLFFYNSVICLGVDSVWH